ncbi:cell wall protein [Microbacterium atlanticum]|uniref:cell wall protein n=1 Tax=Microbacterium atlanticum TaxID=2782168 RepID=UPI001888D276|nr:cell wall protein [Microbacterium atlanticum]
MNATSPHSRFIATTVATVVAAFLALTPTAASASPIYPPSDSCTTSPASVEAGGTVAFECAEATFSGDESVTITVTGENGADARIGMVRFDISTASEIVTSEADGSLAAIDITLPADSSGTYNIAAVSASSAGGTAAVSVVSASGLPATGLDSQSTMGLWIGGGALVLAGVALAGAAVWRRTRDNI